MAYATRELNFHMRLDLYLAKQHGMSRSRAKALIEQGCVRLSGRTVTKPAFDVDTDLAYSLDIDDGALPYVSRGGLKLRGALECFEISVNGRVCADIGASTGGFTDCLLQNGASRVYAVDSGSGQLAESLRADGRVISLEHFNARNLTAESFGEYCSLAVADLSFISQTLVLPAVSSVLEVGGEYIGLIKPQFECGREAVGKGGLVRSAADHLRAVERVVRAALECFFSVMAIAESPILGGDGNREFLLYAKKTSGNTVCVPTRDELINLTRRK